MNDVIGEHAWNRLSIGTGRRCVATSKQTGERCRRAPIVGGFVCSHHGGEAPQVRKSASERLLAMIDPALDALLRALQTGPPCPHCGRSDTDRDPVVLRAAQMVLDRSGYHPTIALQHAAPSNKFAGMNEDALVIHLEELLEQARANQRRLHEGQRLLAEAQDGYVIEDADDPPIHDDAVPFPEGNDTPDGSTEDK